MTGSSRIYITTRRDGDRTEVLDAHRKLEYAREQLREIEADARRAGARTVHTQAGCCLRVQKGDAVTYYEIINRNLK